MASSSASAGASGKKILLLGSSGNVGTATIAALTHAQGIPNDCKVTVGSRRPDSALHKAKQHTDNITAKKADMSDKSSMLPLMREHDAVFIITPGAQNRTELTCNAIDCAVDAMVKFVLLVSVPSVGTDTMFGGQLKVIEDHLRSTQLNFCILRLPLFVDNFLGFKDQIVSTKSIMAPLEGDKKFTLVAVRDVGLVAAKILTDFEKHFGKTYTLTTPSTSYNEICRAFSEVLGEKIEYQKVSFEATEKAFGELLPAWQARGVTELYKLMAEDGKEEYTNCPSADIERITGQKPTDISRWVQDNRQYFTFGAA